MIYVVVILFVLYITFNVNYFLRTLWTIAISSLKKRQNIFDETYIYGICTTNDLDYNFHMNNSRYFNELDQSRVNYYATTGLYDLARKAGAKLAYTGCTIRFRKEINLFNVFKSKTKLVYWTDRVLYLEHRIETVHDHFLRTVMYCKCQIIGPEYVTMDYLIKQMEGRFIESPSPPESLQRWIDSNSLSSRELRKELEF